MSEVRPGLTTEPSGAARGRPSTRAPHAVSPWLFSALLTAQWIVLFCYPTYFFAWCVSSKRVVVAYEGLQALPSTEARMRYDEVRIQSALASLAFSLLVGAHAILFGCSLWLGWRLVPPESRQVPPLLYPLLLAVPVWNVFWGFPAIRGLAVALNREASKSQPGRPARLVSPGLATAHLVLFHLAVVGSVVAFILELMDRTFPAGDPVGALDALEVLPSAFCLFSIPNWFVFAVLTNQLHQAAIDLATAPTTTARAPEGGAIGEASFGNAR